MNGLGAGSGPMAIGNLLTELDENGYDGKRIIDALLERLRAGDEVIDIFQAQRVDELQMLTLLFRFGVDQQQEPVFRGMSAAVLADRRLGEPPAVWQEFSEILTIETIYGMLRRPALEQAAVFGYPFTTNSIVMNRNNLEDITVEMQQLRFPAAVVKSVIDKMGQGLKEFEERFERPALKGKVDVVVQVKQSQQSDNYNISKFSTTLNQAKPLAEGHQYVVHSKGDEGKNTFRKFESPYEAMDFFKDQKGESRLVSADKDLKHETELATMLEGKVNYVAKDFRQTYYSPTVSQTYYPERGRGFNIEQAANMIEGRAVYRDDLVYKGAPYQAWVKLDMNSPKDKYMNYQTNQYNNNHGFNLEEVLGRFKIVEAENPAKRAELLQTLRDGERPLVTVDRDGEKVKLYLETNARYHQLNFFDVTGKSEKREQFLKEPIAAKTVEFSKGQEQAKGKEQEAGVGVGV